MKKLCLLLAITLLFLCTACTAMVPGSQTEPDYTTGSSDAANDVSTEASTAPSASAQAVIGPLPIDDSYAYGNMQINIPGGNFASYDDQILFFIYANEKFTLYTYNRATGETSPFCKDATCTGSSCPSRIATGNLERYEGKIYCSDGFSGVWELKDGVFEKIIRGSIDSFWHANGQLYARTSDNSLVVFENGSTEPRVLLDEYKASWSVVFGQYLYGASTSKVCRIDLAAEQPREEILLEGDIHPLIDGRHIYYADYAGSDIVSGLYRCNMDGSDPVLLTDQPVLPASMNFDNEYIYYRLYAEDFWRNLETEDYSPGEDSLGYDLYRMSKEDPTKIEKIATLPEQFDQIYTVPGCDQIFVVLRSATFSDESGALPVYAVAKNGDTVTQLKSDAG